MKSYYLNALNSAIVKLQSAQLPVKAMYATLKLAKAAKEETETYTNAVTELIKRFGEFDENGELKRNDSGDFVINPENLEECNQQYTELANVDIALPPVRFNLEDLALVNLTFDELLSIEELIEE